MILAKHDIRKHDISYCSILSPIKHALYVVKMNTENAAQYT